jgi:sugar fermentation stimulation protein A
VEDGVALSLDAVTLRGRKHLMELAGALEDGYRACGLFAVKRTDACLFAPNDATDPLFGMALRKAAFKGVEVYAYSSEFRGDVVRLRGRVRVELHHQV